VRLVRLVRLGLGALAVLSCFGVLLAPGAAAEPSIAVSAVTGAPGDVVIVTLDGWNEVTTVAVCGNEARRGAVDCDLIGSIGITASEHQPENRDLIVSVPPTTCPCVLRAATPGEQTVRTVPFTVVGVDTGPVVGADRASGASLRVSAEIVGRSVSVLDALRSGLGGSTRRTLVLTLTNTGTAPIAGLTATAAVGRDTQGGAPLQLPAFEALNPGETRPYNIDVTLSPPSFGSYAVFGTIYAQGTAVSFSSTATTTPWLLVVLVSGLLFDLVAMAILRLGRRRTALRSTQGEPQTTSTRTQTEHSPRRSTEPVAFRMVEACPAALQLR